MMKFLRILLGLSVIPNPTYASPLRGDPRDFTLDGHLPGCGYAHDTTDMTQIALRRYAASMNPESLEDRLVQIASQTQTSAKELQGITDDLRSLQEPWGITFNTGSLQEQPLTIIPPLKESQEYQPLLTPLLDWHRGYP
jgi:hypothetical protein